MLLRMSAVFNLNADNLINTKRLLWPSFHDPVILFNIVNISRKTLVSLERLFSLPCQICCRTDRLLHLVIIHLTPVINREKDAMTYKTLELSEVVQDHHGTLVSVACLLFRIEKKNKKKTNVFCIKTKACIACLKSGKERYNHIKHT